MVSTIRFRSVKAIDVGWRRSYFALFLGAVALALIASHPRLALVVLSYAYVVGRVVALDASRASAAGAGDVLARAARLRLDASIRRRATLNSGYGRVASGSLIVTVVPRPFSLSTSIVPPLNSMLRRAIGRPRPVPVVLVEKYGSNTRASASSSMPTPVSATRDATRRRPRRAASIAQRAAAGHRVQRVLDDVREARATSVRSTSTRGSGGGDVG